MPIGTSQANYRHDQEQYLAPLLTNTTSYQETAHSLPLVYIYIDCILDKVIVFFLFPAQI